MPADFRRLVEAGDTIREADKPASLTIVYGDPKRCCLVGLTLSKTSQIDRLIDRVPPGNSRRGQLRFVFQNRSTMINLDPSGRLALSPPMRKKASLDGEALFVGAGDSFEIWDPGTYASHVEAFEAQLANLATATDAMALLDEPR